MRIRIGKVLDVTEPRNFMSDLFRVPSGAETRWASPENWSAARGLGGQSVRGRKGTPCFSLASGEGKTVAEYSGGSGMLRRIWATIENRSPEVLRGLRLDIFWDGAAKPAVSVPWGDFFGHACGRMARFENELFSSPEGRSFNCVAPMPFRRGMRVVLSNESSIDLKHVFYDVDFTVGDVHDADTCYFHAIWRREAPTSLRRDFAFLPRLEGRGRYLGATVSVTADRELYGNAWWGEGECKVYLDDDDAFPTLVGTGTEDYIGTGWGQGLYAHRFQGAHIMEAEAGRFGFYRLHIPDPIYFAREIKVTMQQIGFLGPKQVDYLIERKRELFSIYSEDTPIDLPGLKERGAVVLFEREDDWAACTYFYLDRPENGLPSLASVGERMSNLPEPDAEAMRRMDA